MMRVTEMYYGRYDTIPALMNVYIHPLINQEANKSGEIRARKPISPLSKNLLYILLSALISLE